MASLHKRLRWNANALLAVSACTIITTAYAETRVTANGGLVTANGGCNDYRPVNGDTVTCTPDGSNPESKGVQTTPDDTSINNVRVKVETGVVLDVNGSTIGLGAGSTVDNSGTLYTRRFRFGYGISAGVSGRSTEGGNEFTNLESGVVLTDGSDSHGMYINARQSSADGNKIVNKGKVNTTGDRADGIRFFTESTDAEDLIDNSGEIATSGVDAAGIHVKNTDTQTEISNSGTITVNDGSAHGILIEGAARVVNSGTIEADPLGYAFYVEDNDNTLANSLTIEPGSDITGGLRFSETRRSETLVFAEGLGSNSDFFEFNNTITGLNQVEIKDGSKVAMSAGVYDLVEANVRTGSDATLEIAGDITGSGGLTKNGVGKLRLSGNNTYSGGTELQAGTIVAASDQALGEGALEAAGAGVALAAGESNLALGNVVSLSEDLIVDTAGEILSLDGSITGSGGLIKRGPGALELSGENSFSGGTQVERGTLALDGDAASSTGEITMSADTAFQAISDLRLANDFNLGGPVEFDTQDFSATLDGVISNNSTGQLIKTGSGTLTLNGTNDYSGGTVIQQGSLALFGSLASGVTVQSGGMLAGSGVVTGDVKNAGRIQPRLNESRSTLNIVGNYVGQDGIFASTLGGSSQAIEADRLAVQGAGNSVSGNTTVVVADPIGVLGKPTDGDGILLVDVNGGATSTTSAFTAPRIAAGAYEYQLVQGGEDSTESWYLRADEETPQPPVVVTPEPSQRQEVALYPALQSLAREYLWSINGSLDDRRGASDVIARWHGQPMTWTRIIFDRIESKSDNANDGPGIKSNVVAFQFGVDAWRGDSAWGRWRAGPVVTIGGSNGNAYYSSDSVKSGDISLNAYSLGLNATLVSDNGAYADLLLFGTRLTDVTAASPLGTSITTTGWALSGSVESGLRLPLNKSVAVTPQAQVYVTTVNLKDTQDSYSLVQMPTETAVVGRLGSKLSYENNQADGPLTQFSARASVYSTLSGEKAATSFLNLQGGNATAFQSRAPGSWMALDTAITVQASENTQLQVGLGYQSTFDNEYRGGFGQLSMKVGF